MTPPPPSRQRNLLALLLPLFLLSGISGLVYQVLWLRLLSLVFGVTTHAASTVLAGFMAGLALGSFFAGRLVDRARRPLVWFGVAEILVGAFALATRPALDAVQQLYVDLHPALAGQPALHALVRFALAFAVLVVPTTLMGATLPIVIKSSLLDARGLGANVGLLYGINTAGAIAGTLLCGFVLIGDYGIRTSFHFAAAVNFAVGAIAVLAGRRLVVTADPVPAAAAQLPPPPAPPAASTRAQRVLLAVFAVSGFASLALEVIWFRMLTAMLNTTTYAFTGMLATVLTGIALGSLLAAPWLRRPRDWWSVLATLEVLVGLAALGSLFLLAQSYRLLEFAHTLAPGVGSGPLLALIACFAAMFPTCLLLGIAFPIGLKVYTGDAAGAVAGRRVGVFYALNLTGAIAGALAAGFVLLPGLGSRVSLAALAALLVASGLVLLPHVPVRRRRWQLAALGAGGLALALPFAPDPFAAALVHRHPGETVLWREEGTQTTVAVHRTGDGTKVLYLDGKHQADDRPGMLASHRWIGDAGMLLHPRPRRALVIGLGGGATPGAVARFPDVLVDVVELSDSVVRAADRYFADANFGVVQRPNVRMIVDDGRNFLLLNRGRYDLVTADIIQPYHAGAGMLYALEYYRLARAALADGGLMVQWACGRTEAELKMIMRTFLTVFPETVLFGGYGLYLMVGGLEPLRVRETDFDRKLADPRWRELMAGHGIESFTALQQYFRATPASLTRFVGDAPVLTDDRPLVEYHLSIRAEHVPVRVGLWDQLLAPGPEHFVGLDRR